MPFFACFEPGSLVFPDCDPESLPDCCFAHLHQSNDPGLAPACLALMEILGMEAGDPIRDLVYLNPVMVAEQITVSGAPLSVQARMSRVFATGLHWCGRAPLDVLTPAPADVRPPPAQPPAQARVWQGPCILDFVTN